MIAPETLPYPDPESERPAVFVSVVECVDAIKLRFGEFDQLARLSGQAPRHEHQVPPVLLILDMVDLVAHAQGKTCNGTYSATEVFLIAPAVAVALRAPGGLYFSCGYGEGEACWFHDGVKVDVSPAIT